MRAKEALFVRYEKCLPPLNEMDEALRCVRLRHATENSAKEKHDVVEKPEDRNAVAANDWVGAVPFHIIVRSSKCWGTSVYDGAGLK